MDSQDILNVSLSIAALAVAGSIIYGVYHLVLTLKRIRAILRDIKSTTLAIQALKNTIKFGLTNITGKLLGSRKQ